jgi:hypothetical protein
VEDEMADDSAVISEEQKKPGINKFIGINKLINL